MRQITPLRLDRVARAVGSGDRDERFARARVEALSRVAHPGLCLPLDVVREADAVVVCSPRLRGIAASAAGPCEELGAWVWLVAGIAEALAVLHGAGLAHGDVSPANVVIGARPVLVDLVGSAVAPERGTAGFASPERTAGGGPSPADDVHALGALAVACAGEAIRIEAQAWMAPLLAADPSARPTARAVARGLVRCAEPTRWHPGPVPEAEPVASSATVRDPRAWHWRLRRHPIRAALVLASAVAVGAWWLWGPEVPAVAGRSEEATATVTAIASAPAAASLPDPVAAATELTRARVAALAAGDGEALVALTVPGTSAWATAAREGRALEEGSSVDGLTLRAVGATLVEQSDAEAVVHLRYEVDAHTWRDGAGATRSVPSRTERVRMVLAWSGERWRVRAVSAPP
ncbi:hypothetical protein [Demequina gelatinilytica]|uniref:hypothetical protein n=1 Tax=Demequina gelatinilytica TaxID=1638980 RepID=UPI000785C963|nr:hypothetical protein [Demequina gelatinilytica]